MRVTLYFQGVHEASLTMFTSMSYNVFRLFIVVFNSGWNQLFQKVLDDGVRAIFQ